jgi:hypothetical protein
MAIKSNSGLNTDNNALFTANGNQEITGELENAYNEDVNDSMLNRLDDADQHAFKGVFKTTLTYAIGDIITQNGRLLICEAVNTGTFVETEWRDYDEFGVDSGLTDVTIATTTIDIAGINGRFLNLNASGVLTCDKIIGGVHGRRYRIYLPAAITDFSLTSTPPATAISNGTGQLNVPFQDSVPAVEANMIGNAVPQMGDWFEFVYMNNGGKEYNSIIHIQKHQS